MKYLKLFEDKTFTQWLKDPKKPQEKKTEYIYTKHIIKRLTLVENGNYSYKDLIEFVKDNHGTDLYREISDYTQISIRELKRDSDKLEAAFEDYISNYYGGPNNRGGKTTGWSEFLEEYFVLEDELDQRQYKDLVDFLQENIDKKFYNEESWMRILDTEILDGYKNETDKIYIKVITSREALDNEEKRDIIEHVDNLFDIGFDNNTEYIQIDGGRLRFDVEIIPTGPPKLEKTKTS